MEGETNTEAAPAETPKMPIRAKFRCYSVTDYGHDGKRVKLTAQYDSAIEEDRRFAKATPDGEFEMLVTNPAALARLTPGTTFYIDLIEAN